MKFLHIGIAFVIIILALLVLSVQQIPQPSNPGTIPILDLVGNGPAIGPENAKVTIVEFSDYQCPGCLLAEGIVKEILKEYDGKIRFVYRNFPLYSIHPKASITAEAAMAARDQNKFWEMHDKLFANQASISQSGLPAIKQIAKELGLNETLFNEAMNSKKYSAAVLADYTFATKNNMRGTPTFFVNGKEYFDKINSVEDFKKIIDAELAK